MAQELKKSIYLQGGVIDVYTETRNKERPQSFSKRMGQIVDRYHLILDSVNTPELSVNEKHVLGVTIQGSYIDKLFIKYLHEEIDDTELDGASDLAKKVKRLDFLQRIKLIEEMKL